MDFIMDQNNSNTWENDLQSQQMWSPSPSHLSQATDVTLLIEQWQFRVHKSVLEKWSDYFKAMFSSKMLESMTDQISLKIISAEQFKILVEGMYSGSLELTCDNIFSVVEVVQILQVKSSLYDQCTDFLRAMLNTDYGLEVMFFCEVVHLTDLYNDARRYCLAHFSELRHNTSFFDLTIQELHNYMSDKYLVVKEEIHVVEALHKWFCHSEGNVVHLDDLRGKMQKIVTDCVHVKNIEGAQESVTAIIMGQGQDHEQVEDIMELLVDRPRQEDVFLFWSLLTSTNADGLVDIVKLNMDTGEGTHFGSMESVVDKPGFDMGSAVCSIGTCVYLTGGGPTFGSVRWIRQVLKYDTSEPRSGWVPIGDLIEFRRYHAMVAVSNKLYIFGGFGNFRVRNQKLHSFHIASGTWEELQPMPVHEISPTATSYRNNIYYTDRSWKVHCFNIADKFWYSLKSGGNIGRNHNITLPPIALHGLINLSCDCLLAVVNEQNKIRVVTLELHQPTNNVEYISIVNCAEFVNEFSFEGSVVVNGKLLILLGSLKQDDIFNDEANTNRIQNMKLFNPVSKTFTDLPAVQNVRKALSIVAVPHLPTTFQGGGAQV